MSNPLNNKNNFNQSQHNPINDMLNFLNNGGNSQQIFNQMFANNPQLKMLQAIQNPKEMVMQLAKQKGIDINQIEELARKLGAK